jgi:site-specific DNA-methyltransferase (adenine-specific)
MEAGGMRPYYEDTEAGITIYHADCRTILPTLEAGSVDLVLTDFPYGNGTVYGGFVDSAENLNDLINAVLPEVRRLANVALISCGVMNMPLFPAPTWVLSWHWEACRTSSAWGFANWAPILAYGPDPYLARGLGRRPDSFRYIANVGTDGTNGHPCPKPISLWRRLLVRGSPATGEMILDPLMGSGTTLRAAKDLGRRCIGVEIEEKYCEIAARRLSQQVMALEV